MDLSPFTWNGTYIGILTEDNILAKFYAENSEYWNIKIGNFSTSCLIRKSKNDYTHCLVDELKPVFGLSKLGTHYAWYAGDSKEFGTIPIVNSSFLGPSTDVVPLGPSTDVVPLGSTDSLVDVKGYIILIRARVNLTGDKIVSDYLLTGVTVQENSELYKQVRNIYIFRDLLCLNKSTDSTIALRRNEFDEAVYPVSLLDSCIKKERLLDISISTSLSEIVFNKWIKEESPRDILRVMCKIFNRDNISLRIFKLRSYIESIVKKVCEGEHTEFTDILIAKIISKLQYKKNMKK